MNLKRKISLTSGLFVVLAVSAVSIQLYSLFTGYIQQSVQQQVIENGHSQARDISHWIQGKIAVFQNLVETAELMDSRDFILQTQLKIPHLRNEFVAFFAGFEGDKSQTDNTGWVAPEGFDFHNMPFYTKAKQYPGIVLTDPYQESVTKDLILTVSKISHIEGLETIFGADFNMQIVQRVLNDLNFNNSGYAFLVDGTHKIISHQDQQYINKSIDQLIKTSSSIQLSSNLQPAVVDQRDVMVAFAPIKVDQVDWYIAMVIDQQKAFAAVTNAGELAMVYAIAALLISVLLLSLALTKMLKPLAMLSRAMSDIASGEGDLTRKISINSKDELADVANHFNSFTQKIREIIKSAISNSNQLDQMSSQVMHQSQQSNQSLQSQLQEVEQLATSMNQMASTANDVASNAQQASQAASAADQAAANGDQVMMETADTISHLSEEVQQAMQAVDQLAEQSGDIESIIDVINGIAEQTNLLALNAAIEAARAGEQGRGFAVVADEVRSLAARTQQSTKEIQQVIQQLRDGTEKTVTIMSSSAAQVEKTVIESDRAKCALAEITAAINTISQMNLQIACSAEEQSAVSEEINRNTLNIKDYSHNIEERSEKTLQISNQLATHSQQQKQLLNQFKV